MQIPSLSSSSAAGSNAGDALGGAFGEVSISTTGAGVSAWWVWLLIVLQIILLVVLLIWK